jgi:hypothetical protein
MYAVVIEAKNKKDVKFWLDLAKKIGTHAISVDMVEVEDAYMALLIDKGMKTGDLNRESVMKKLKASGF